MRSLRGFIVGTSITAVAIGIFRGVVVSIVSESSGSTALLQIAVNIGLALYWVPIAMLVSWLIGAGLASRRRLTAMVALGIASLPAEAWLAQFMWFGRMPPPPFLSRLIGRGDTSMLFYIAIVGAAAAAAARRRQVASELAASNVQAALAGAQLHVLTLQLQPHFLFNALNLISQLAYESIEAAQRAVANLHALLVESLRHAVHREVSLGDELRFLHAYLEIQQARFRDRLRVDIVAPLDVQHAAVPHLLLQPLVENAIVHGLSPRASAGSLSLSARRSGDRLILTVEDDGTGLTGEMREGIGLTNTRLRLEQLFGADHRLSISPRSPSGARVIVDLPLREASPASADDDMSDAAPQADTSSTEAPSVLERIPRWLQVVAGWAAIAMLWTEVGAIPSPIPGREFSYSVTLTAYLINAGIWVLLTPFVVRLARRFDLANRPTSRVIALHVVLAVATSAAHTASWLGTLWVIRSPAFRANLHSMFGWWIWDVAAYAAIVAFATVIAFSAKFRDVRLGIARDRARLASARVASLRLRLQPRVLLASLDALARVIAVDAEASEATIARIGDLLRMLLSRADREFVSVDEELELLDAYLDVVNAPRAVSRTPTDLPRVADVADELIPAMLLPTLAASMNGHLEILRLGIKGECLELAVRSGALDVDCAGIDECIERLRRLYGRRERSSIAIDASGRTIVELELPLTSDLATPTPDSRCDLATA